MTRPMQENRDKTTETQYATRQLQRRPAPLFEFEIPSEIAVSLCIATRGSFSASNGTSITWTDVDTNDTAAFGVTNGSGTNDRILLKKAGIYLILTGCGASTTSDAGSDWGIGTTTASVLPVSAVVSAAVAANLIDWELGQASTETKIVIASGTSGWVQSSVSEVRSGTIAMAFAGQQILYFPATSNTLTDIL